MHPLQQVTSWEKLREEHSATFDSLCATAALVLKTTACEINIVGMSEQFHLGKFPGVGSRVDALPDSLCRFVVQDKNVVSITDCTIEARHLVSVVREGLISSYLGVPLMFDGEVIGSFCVGDKEPRKWTERDVSILRDFAKCVGLDLAE